MGFWVFCGDEAFIHQNGDQLFDLPRSSSYINVRLMNAYGRLLNADVRLLTTKRQALGIAALSSVSPDVFVVEDERAKAHGKPDGASTDPGDPGDDFPIHVTGCRFHY